MLTLVETTETTYRMNCDGTPRTFDRVTAALSVVRDLSGIPADVLAHAAERGKAVHRGCWLLCGRASSPLHWPSVHPEVVPYLEGFLAFLKTTKCQVLDKEQLVVSTVFGYAGRADLVVEGLGPYLTILDLKTGEPDASHSLQLGAYIRAYQEMLGIRKTVLGNLLYLRPNGTYRMEPAVRSKEQADRLFVTFSQVLGTFRWMQAHPMNGES